jgi:hypothetical protein
MTLENVNWDALADPDNYPNGDYSIADNPEFIDEMTVIPLPTSYEYCFADIDRSDDVDVDDLIEVILGWGAFDPPPSGVAGPHPPCRADIAPIICGDNTVNVDDLIAIILNWGGCPAHPPCGAEAATIGGPAGSMPQSVDDCYDQCNTRFPGGGDDFMQCYAACIEALCEAEIIECD